MRKIFAILVTIVLFVIAFTGCSSKEKGTVSSSSDISSDIVSSKAEDNSSEISSDDSGNENKTDSSSTQNSNSESKTENGGNKNNGVETTEPHSHITYAKSGKLMYYNLSSNKSWQAANKINYDLPRLSVDGKSMFYFMRSDLYYRKVESSDAAVKIASNVGWFLFEEYGSSVIYKTNNNILYRSDLKKSTEIDRNVAFIAQVSKDGKRLLYGKEKSGKYDIYHFDGTKAQKIISEASDIYTVIDFSVIYYIKNRELYRKEGNKAEVKIAGDVEDVHCFYDNGVYYAANSNGTQTLYFYDKNTSTKLAENYIFSKYDSNRCEIIYRIPNSQNSEQYDYYVAIGKKVIKFGVDPSEISIIPRKVRFDSNGNIFFCGTSLGDGASHIYKLSASSGTTEKYESEISAWAQILTFKGDTIIYFKGGNEAVKTATFFVNRKKIADNVYTGWFEYSEDIKATVYITDWVDRTTGGTLWFCKDGQQPVKVAEKVSEFILTPSGEIAYIKNKGANGGALYINKFAKDSVKIDDNVSGVSYGQYGYGLS